MIAALRTDPSPFARMVYRDYAIEKNFAIVRDFSGWMCAFDLIGGSRSWSWSGSGSWSGSRSRSS